MKKLSLQSIRIDGGTQARVKLNDSVVTEYAALMREGVNFPAITVFFDGSDYWLVDGFHRYFAKKQNGIEEVEVEVKNGTLREAIFFALGANGKNGLPTTHEDKKNSIRILMADEEYAGMTNSMIAKHIGCSPMTVGRIKKELEEGAQKTDPVKTYTTKDGIEKKVDTTKLATKKKEEPKEEPEDTADAIGELTDVVSQLEEENKKLRDAVALGQFDATDIEKFDIQETLEELREENRRLKIENESLRKSRDDYQKENAELIRTVKSLQKKLKQVA